MSTLPNRRILRTTRTTTTRENENAHARPQRTVSRAKPLSSVVQNTSTTAAKAKAIADSETTDAHGKRKREILTEVPPNIAHNRTLRTTTTKGKETLKKFDGVVIAKAKPSSTRPPSSSKSSVFRRSETVATIVDDLPSVREEIEVPPTSADDKMAVDVPFQPAVPEIVSTYQQQYISSRHAEEEEDEPRSSKRFRTSSEAPYAAADIEEGLDEGEDDLFDLHLHSIEADPNGDEWDDLDADDGDDTIMVNEYVVEIFEYLKQNELCTLPNPNYMHSHKELSWRMRGVLLDWIIGVHSRCRLLPETFHLCTNLLDRFMSVRVCSLAKYQLVGITCLFIAAKVEETAPPAAEDLIALTDGTYTDGQMFTAERYILKTLDYNLNHPNVMHYLRRISKADDYNLAARTLGKYFAEIGCMEWRLLATPPSLLAASAMWLARLVLEQENWTPNLAHYSTYSQSEVIPTANLMLNYVLKPIVYEQFHKKYARKQNMKASEVVRAWALRRWDEGQMVDLHRELPTIKADIRARRQLEEEAQSTQKGIFSRLR